jgi:phage terminase small subunit
LREQSLNLDHHMARNKLTPKQDDFLLAYYETGNACEAYRRAYKADSMTSASIDKEARRLLKDPRITPRLHELAERREVQALLSLEEARSAERRGMVSTSAHCSGWRSRRCNHILLASSPSQH